MNKIGHNSVQVPHNGRYQPDTEMAWRRFERAQVRNERFQLIKKGVIIPSFRMPPQMMVKNADGTWSLEIKRHA